MKSFNMPSAKRALEAAVFSIEKPAVEYIDWEEFEKELDAVMMTDPEPSHVKDVFAKAVTRSRAAYHAFVKAGRHFIQ